QLLLNARTGRTGLWGQRPPGHDERMFGMPAVTVDDVGALPKVGPLDGVASVPRPVLAVTTAPAAYEGEGFPVHRAFAGVDRRHLDPFIHMDQMGEVEYA